MRETQGGARKGGVGIPCPAPGWGLDGAGGTPVLILGGGGREGVVGYSFPGPGCGRGS